ncbi:MAG: adenylate/guanylate cyclase domain-containing protein, partial [Thermostichales cyanobacterium SZTDM-1c_bins_54]
PYLIVTSPDGCQQRYELQGETVWTLGRDLSNKIVLRDSSVSRHHALLQGLDSNSIYLIDLGSSNGSFVNERRITIPTLLRDGDRITLGQTELTFRSGGHPLSSDQSTPTTSGDETAILHVRRLISVLVVDIRGFTQLTQSLDERLLSRVMGEWFQAAGEITRHNDSRVDKYIGDAVMAVWFDNPVGAAHPKTAPMDAKTKQVFRALGELFAMTTRLSQKYALPEPMRLGAGVNTGYAIVGQMGSAERQEYTVLGDTVNVAFRLESATRFLDSDIVISEETFASLPPAYQGIFATTEVLLKGYESPRRVYHTTLACFQQML